MKKLLFTSIDRAESRDNPRGSRISLHRLAGCCVVAMLFTATLLAQQKLTPMTLGGWHIIHGVPVIDPVQDTVALPVGGELGRTFDVAQLSVRLVSRPYFSPAPAGWPVLEVGPASLTFVRDAAGGAMMLLGDKPLSLPFTIALGADGRSEQPLDFTLGYDQARAAANLVLGGRTFIVSAAAPPGPIEVTITAGTASPWPLELLAVDTTPASDTPAASSYDTQPTSDVSTTTKPMSTNLAEAAQRRTELADAVMRGELTPEKAMAELRKIAQPRGKLDADAAFAFAAIQVGEMLVANVRLDSAELFFRAAEPALHNAKVRSAKATDQALCLTNLAWIRFRYLKQETQAKADIEAAYQLRPNDKHLQQLRQRLTGQQPQDAEGRPRS